MSEDETKVVVLVADDEPSTLALVASHVRSKGYEVLEASDGDQAWQLAHEHLPDLVILDVMMPGMSGWEVCRKIREAVSLAHTGVIMLTGIGENLNEMTSPLYGADTYLDKPFEFSELDSRIDETLASRKDGAMGRPDASEPVSSTPRPGNGMAAQPSLAKATLRSEPPPAYDDDEIDDDDDSEDDLNDDDATSEDSSEEAASASSADDADDEEPATMPKPKLKSQAPKKASKSVIAKAASVVGPFLEKAAKILNRGGPKKAAKAAPKKAAKAAPKKAAPKKAAKAAPKKAAKAAPKNAAPKAAPKKAAKAAPKKASKKPAPKKAAPKAAPKKAAKAAKAAPKKPAKGGKPAAPKKAPAKAVKAAPAKPAKAAAKKAPAPSAKPEAKKGPSKAKAKGPSRATQPSPAGDVTP